MSRNVGFIYQRIKPILVPLPTVWCVLVGKFVGVLRSNVHILHEISWSVMHV